jgi:hypothetical protein
MHTLTKLVDSFIERVFSKRYNPAFAKIFCNWQKLVGEPLAKVCVPIMIDKFDKVLVIEIYDQTRSIELHFMQDIIVERINILLASYNLEQKITRLYLRKNL